MATLLQYLRDQSEETINDFMSKSYPDAFAAILPARGARTKSGINSSLLVNYVGELKTLY
jgi:hypothetical protein